MFWRSMSQAQLDSRRRELFVHIHRELSTEELEVRMLQAVLSAAFDCVELLCSHSDIFGDCR
jgi:hypothetical protein